MPGSMEAAGPAEDDSFDIPAESETWIDVLENDNDLLIVESVDVDGRYASAWVEDGVMKVQPRPGFLGPLDFTYVAGDGFQSSSATVHLRVRPQLRDDYGFTRLGQDVVIDVLGNDRGARSVLSLVQASGGTATIEPDKRVRFSPSSSGRTDFFYDVDDGNGGFRRARVVVHVQGFVLGCRFPLWCPGPAVPPLVAPDLHVEAMADGEAILVSLPPNAGQLITGLDGAYGTVTRVDSLRLRYQPARLHGGVDRFVYYVADSSGRWDQGVVTLDFQNPALVHHFAFDGGGVFSHEVWDSARPGKTGWLKNGGSLFPDAPRRSVPSVVGGQSLDLTADDQGLAQVVAPVGREEGTVTAWINFPASLKHGTGLDAMTIFATSTNSVLSSTGWSLALEPTGPTSASLRVREGGDDFATEELEWEPGTWYHVAYVWSDLNRALYVDGTAFAESDPDDPARLASHGFDGASFAIGNRPECSHSPCGASFAGFIDELKVFDQRLDRADVRHQLAVENPAVDFRLGVDDLTQNRHVENLASPADGVALVQVQGAPYRLRSPFGGVGLQFDEGGGHLRWQIPSGSFDVDAGWIAWELRLPAVPLTQDVVLAEDDGGLFRVALEVINGTEARLALRDRGNLLLASPPILLEVGQALEILVGWDDGEAGLFLGAEELATSSQFGFSFSSLPTLRVPLAPGAQLWMLQQGKPKHKPKQRNSPQGGNDGTITRIPDQSYTVKKPVVIWIPGKGASDMVPAVWPGNADLDEETGFGAVCRGSVPKKLACKGSVLPLVRQDAQGLTCLMTRYKLPWKLGSSTGLFWWHRGEKKVVWEATFNLNTALEVQRYKTSQFKGTGGSTPKASSPSAPPQRTLGIAMSAWTGFKTDGGPSDDWCEGWATPNPGFKGAVGKAKSVKGDWLSSGPDSCSEKRTVRCACLSKAAIELISRTGRVKEPK